MALSDTERAQAETRMQTRLDGAPRAVSARYDKTADRVVVLLETGVELGFPPALAEGLADANPAELSDVHVTPSGTGLHFPKLDADIYVPALLEGVFGSRRWMARTLGKAGGARTSDAKSHAARANGKLGGRPRKTAAT